MLGNLFVKYQTECGDSIRRSFFVEKPNEGIILYAIRDRYPDHLRLTVLIPSEY